MPAVNICGFLLQIFVFVITNICGFFSKIFVFFYYKYLCFFLFLKLLTLKERGASNRERQMPGRRAASLVWFFDEIILLHLFKMTYSGLNWYNVLSSQHILV